MLYRIARQRRIVAQVGLAAALLGGSNVWAQDARSPSASEGASSSPNESTGSSPVNVKTLLRTIQSLESDVRALSMQVAQLESEETRSQKQVNALEQQLAKLGVQQDTGSAQQSYGSPQPEENVSATPLNSSLPDQEPNSGAIEQRVAALEENQDLLNSKVTEQSQTKVESGSKYRVRFSGLILFNLYDNRGYVDNQDFPQIALENYQPTGNTGFGASLRQSQIGVEAFGPNIAGARTSASINFDFAGGFPNEPNGAVMGLVRLRTATVRFDWHDTSIVAGQDHLFFVPLAPTSLATAATPAFSYAGNLWSWTPQVRAEHTIHFSEKSSLLLQEGILDSLSGDWIYNTADARYPSWGEQSGMPAVAARIAVTHPIFGQQATFGTGGYYGRQYWGFGRNVDGWASTLDAFIPLGNKFVLTGAFYRGRALGGLWGGIGQNVLLSGSLFSPTTIVRGLDSMGGWMQLKYKLLPKFEINGAFGQDNPFAGELDRFPAGQSYYGPSFTRNQSPMVNFIYSPRSDVELSFEYRRLRTMVLDHEAQTANHFDASVGYRF